MSPGWQLVNSSRNINKSVHPAPTTDHNRSPTSRVRVLISRMPWQTPVDSRSFMMAGGGSMLPWTEALANVCRYHHVTMIWAVSWNWYDWIEPIWHRDPVKQHDYSGKAPVDMLWHTWLRDWVFPESADLPWPACTVMIGLSKLHQRCPGKNHEESNEMKRWTHRIHTRNAASSQTRNAASSLRLGFPSVENILSQRLLLQTI